jgi:DNA-binding transcriptional LysR family regulator
LLPDIDSLALFVRAAELRSLTKAAEASHIGLAAASRRMALLEHRFRTTLLERSSRGVELTAAGMSLLPHARALLVELNLLQAEMRDHANGRKGALRVLANTSVITDTLPVDLAAFAHNHPDITVIVHERWSEEIVNDLQAAEADVGIVVEGTALEGMETRPYCQDRLAVVMPHNHALAAFDTLNFSDVLDDELITLEGGSSMTRLLASQAVIAQKTLQLRIQVRSFEAVCHMVDAGLGLGILPEQAARVLAKGLDLTVRPFSDPWAERRMLLCTRKDRASLPSVTKLLDFLCNRGHLSGANQPMQGSES